MTKISVKTYRKRTLANGQTVRLLDTFQENISERQAKLHAEQRCKELGPSYGGSIIVKKPI